MKPLGSMTIPEPRLRSASGPSSGASKKRLKKSRKGSSSRPRSSAASSPATGSRCGAPAAGSRAPTPTTRPRPSASSPSTASSPKRRRDQLRREGPGEPLRQTRPRLGPPPPPRAPPRDLQPPPGGSATWSARSTCTPTTCGSGPGRAQRRLHTRVHEADPASPTRSRSASTGSRTASPATGPRRSAPTPTATTSN